MSWSHIIDNRKKPFWWWFHKLLCELGWFLKHSGRMYRYHLDKLSKTGFNLYGEPNYNSKKWPF
jgi:hypothetical protein